MVVPSDYFVSTQLQLVMVVLLLELWLLLDRSKINLLPLATDNSEAPRKVTSLNDMHRKGSIKPLSPVEFASIWTMFTVSKLGI